MRRVRLRSEGWTSGPVLQAESFGDRLLGLHRLSPNDSLLMATSSVHGWGMRRPFRAIGLTSDLVVVAQATVRPWRMVWFRGCSYVVEMPLEVEPPPAGAQMELTSG